VVGQQLLRVPTEEFRYGSGGERRKCVTPAGRAQRGWSRLPLPLHQALNKYADESLSQPKGILMQRTHTPLQR
jgi:hypothetical protein